MMCGAVLMAEHVLSAALPSSDIVSGPVETLNSATVELAVSYVDVITVNDTKVTGANMAVRNGIVHVIDTVLLPPATTNPLTAIAAATMAAPVDPRMPLWSTPPKLRLWTSPPPPPPPTPSCSAERAEQPKQAGAVRAVVAHRHGVLFTRHAVAIVVIVIVVVVGQHKSMHQ